MGQVLHDSATTTKAVRRAIPHSQESLIRLSKRYGVKPKIVAKWRKRTNVLDSKTGPTDPKSTVLTIEEEAVIVAFRRHTLLPLDDCLYTLQATIPHLTRSPLHRCLQRHGISRLPEVESDKPDKKKFKAYPIGYFHIDISEVRTEQGKLHMFVAIDRTSKFAFVELHEKATTAISAGFLRSLLKAVPYKVHTLLTDNGIQFTTPGAGGSAVRLIKEAIAAGESDAVSTRLMDTHYRVCAAPEFLAKAPALNQPASLSNHSCVLFTLVEFRSRWLFRDASNNIAEVPDHGDVVISNALAVRECAIMGLGPALLPNWLIDEDLREGCLVDVFPKFQVAATTSETGVWALYPSRSFLPTKVRVAIDFLRQQLRTSDHRKPARNKSDAL